ncbi:phage portal protein [Marilutibacter aestuarii]|uniref:Phage portal protein n=1 Tax=Marilutibacter aestuarii TaxID=1706195 RepID=A0A508AN94_9GAMM|nr:phage portal protein [Lysobacter aestuarii]TQD51229.1 phage portal protein [Lysobacter aestuarii]
MAGLTATVARERLQALIPTDHAVIAAEARHDQTRRELDSARRVQAVVHEATRPSRSRKMALDHGSGDRIVGLDAKQLRDSARALCRDHDVARTVLSVLVQNVVGSGIDVIPAPRRRGGKVDRGLAQDLRDAWDLWWDRPEVTWQHDFGKSQQLLFGGCARDGESFFQDLTGRIPYLDHGTEVPFSIEMLEADLIPLDFNDEARNIRQGVERNAWGRPVAWHVYKQHPGDGLYWKAETKRVPAEFICQLANIDRIHQVRGLSMFAPVMNRLRDIQDYEDSERIAAKVAASLCAQIIKGDASGYGSSKDPVTGQALEAAAYRALTMVPGMIGDDLLPGEQIEILDSKRPNPNVAVYINDQLRRVAGGTSTSHSSVSKNYDGTYSAQRQELVEQWGAYAMLGEFFTARTMRPIWTRFVQACLLARIVRLPRGWTQRELMAAIFVRPQMPWIDPLKEALARGEMEDRGWQAPQQNILLSGNDPEEVLRLREDWRDQTAGQSTPQDTNPDDTRASRRSLARALALKEPE